MRCKKCGKELEKEWKVCPYCGKEVSEPKLKVTIKDTKEDPDEYTFSDLDEETGEEDEMVEENEDGNEEDEDEDLEGSEARNVDFRGEWDVWDGDEQEAYSVHYEPNETFSEEGSWSLSEEVGDSLPKLFQDGKEIKKRFYRNGWFWMVIVAAAVWAVAVACFTTKGGNGNDQADRAQVRENFYAEDFEDLIAGKRSDAKKFGLVQEQDTGVFTGLDGHIRVVFQGEKVESILLDGPGDKMPAFQQVRIGMDEETVRVKYGMQYGEQDEANHLLKYYNLKQKRRVECRITDGKASEIAFYVMTDEEVKSYKKLREEKEETDYVFPDSDKRYLTTEEIREIPKDRLVFGENEILARYGYAFENATLRQYFEERSWYHEKLSEEEFSDKMLNDYERQNLELIRQMEQE